MYPIPRRGGERVSASNGSNQCGHSNFGHAGPVSTITARAGPTGEPDGWRGFGRISGVAIQTAAHEGIRACAAFRTQIRGREPGRSPMPPPQGGVFEGMFRVAEGGGPTALRAISVGPASDDRVHPVAVLAVANGQCAAVSAFIGVTVGGDRCRGYSALCDRDILVALSGHLVEHSAALFESATKPTSAVTRSLRIASLLCRRRSLRSSRSSSSSWFSAEVVAKRTVRPFSDAPAA